MVKRRVTSSIGDKTCPTRLFLPRNFVQVGGYWKAEVRVVAPLPLGARRFKSSSVHTSLQGGEVGEYFNRNSGSGVRILPVGESQL